MKTIGITPEEEMQVLGVVATGNNLTFIHQLTSSTVLHLGNLELDANKKEGSQISANKKECNTILPAQRRQIHLVA
jgi:hypothetical protein